MISIHEAARLRLKEQGCNGPVTISIHEAARLRQRKDLYAWTPGNFNPRSRKASTTVIAMDEQDTKISIHEAARLRQAESFVRPVLYEFQSTKPQGFDYHTQFIIVKDKIFNPRSRKASTKPVLFPPWPMLFQSTKPQGFDITAALRTTERVTISIHEAARLRLFQAGRYFISQGISIHEAARLRQLSIDRLDSLLKFQSTKPQGFDTNWQPTDPVNIISIHEAARLRRQKHPKNNLILQNNLYTYYNIPTHNNHILIIFNLFTIKSTIFQVRISRDFHVHFLFAPNNSILKYHN